MKDILGQEINVGDTILHAGRGAAGLWLHTVVKINPRRLSAERSDGERRSKTVSLEPRTVINVTANRVLLEGNHVLAEKQAFEDNIRDANLLQCLEAAGIDNCEAYSIGYQEFAKQEADE